MYENMKQVSIYPVISFPFMLYSYPELKVIPRSFYIVQYISDPFPDSTMKYQ